MIFFLLISVMFVFAIVSFCIFDVIRRELRLRKLVLQSFLDNSGKTTVLADLVSENQRMPEPEYQSTGECH